MFVEVFLAVRDTAEDLIVERLRWDEERDGEYTGPLTNRQYRLFNLMADQEHTRRLHKSATIGGNVWKLWRIPFNEPGDVLRLAKDEIDQLLIDYPTFIAVAGAFLWDGRQVGTEWVYGDVTRDVTIVDPDWDGVVPQIANPDYQPDSSREDYDGRQTIDDPRFRPPTVVVQVTSTERVGTTGTPMYPVHARLIDFMPDRLDADGNVIGPALTLSDVNLLYGQSPRQFA